MAASYKDIIKSEKTIDPYFTANFNWPKGIAVDPEGSIIFADAQNGQIFKLLPSLGKLVTIAGTGISGYKDGIGLSAQFNYPTGVDVGSDGTIYVADANNDAVRKITRAGKVSTISSSSSISTSYDLAFYEAESTIFVTDGSRIGRIFVNGSGGYKLWAGKSMAGYQDGIGTDAQFNGAYGMSINQITGDLYVTEFGNDCIRKITPKAVVTTLVKGLREPWGIYVNLNETIYITELLSNRIKKYSFETGRVSVVAGSGNSGVFDGLGESADLCLPTFITFNPFTEEILFSEWGTGIRVINKFQMVSTLIMPSGMGLIDGDRHVSRYSMYLWFTKDDSEENIYISDHLNNSIRKLSLRTGKTMTIAGKQNAGNVVGNVTDALFSNPAGIIYLNGDLYFADKFNNAVKRLDLANQNVETFLNTNRPLVLSLDSSKSHIYQREAVLGASIYKYNLDGHINDTIADDVMDCVDGYYKTAKILDIEDMYAFSDGTLYFTDQECNTVRLYNPATQTISTVAGQTENQGYKDGSGKKVLFGSLFGFDFHPMEKVFYIIDQNNNMIRRMTLMGNVTTFAGSMTAGYRNGNLSIALFKKPGYLRILSSGEMIVCDEGNYAIRSIGTDGIVQTISGYGSRKYWDDPGDSIDLNEPSGMTSNDQSNIIYIANKEDNNIVKIDSKTNKSSLVSGNGGLGWFDGEPLQSMYNRPEDVTFDKISSSLFVADTKNHLIRRINLDSGLSSTFAGTGNPGSKSTIRLSSEFNLPSSITADLNWNLFVADSANHVIRKIGINSDSVTIHAGLIGVSDYVDGGLSKSRFSVPAGIRFDTLTKTLIVADSYNHVIRGLNATHVFTIAGNGTSGDQDGPALNAQFFYPKSVGVDNNGDIYVSDNFNDKVRSIKGGIVATLPSHKTLKDPRGLLVLNGALYISFAGDNSLKRILLPQKTSAPTSFTGNSTDLIVALSIAILLASIIGAMSIAKWRDSNTKRKLMMISIAKDKKSQQKSSVSVSRTRATTISEGTGSSTEATGTVTLLAQAKTYAIPGYLALNLQESIYFKDVLGQGGTANVVSGSLKDPKLLERHGFSDVAIKFLSNKTAKDEFYYEITIMSSLPKSDNLVTLVGYCNEPLAIVMKSYPDNLWTYLKDGAKGISLEMKRKLSIDIAKGMSLIHDSGIIHFDLKPANVLLHEVDQVLTAVICDFGFANFTSDGKTNLVKGVKSPTTIGITARYAAPELFSSNLPKYRLEEEQFKKVDVFAYSMTIYNIFTGEKPWKDIVDTFEIETRVVAGERPLITAGHEVPKEIEDLIKETWPQEPKERLSFKQVLEKF